MKSINFISQHIFNFCSSPSLRSNRHLNGYFRTCKSCTLSIVSPKPERSVSAYYPWAIHGHPTDDAIHRISLAERKSVEKSWSPAADANLGHRLAHLLLLLVRPAMTTTTKTTSAHYRFVSNSGQAHVPNSRFRMEILLKYFTEKCHQSFRKWISIASQF